MPSSEQIILIREVCPGNWRSAWLAPAVPGCQRSVILSTVQSIEVAGGGQSLRSSEERWLVRTSATKMTRGCFSQLRSSRTLRVDDVEPRAPARAARRLVGQSTRGLHSAFGPHESTRSPFGKLVNYACQSKTAIQTVNPRWVRRTIRLRGQLRGPQAALETATITRSTVVGHRCCVGSCSPWYWRPRSPL